jgi:DNA-binding transcriptional LysR family regulator
MLDAADLDLVAAVARSGNIRSAAKDLQAHPATLYRRLAALERSMPTPLFYRADGRLKPTEHGELVVRAALEGQARLAELNRKLSGAATVLAGEITVTTTDSLAPIVFPAVSMFRTANPLVRIHVSLSNRDADLAQYEAEVAIRPTRTPPDSLIGRRAGSFSYAVYATSGEPSGWIALDGSLAGIPSSKWLTNRLGDETPVITVNSMWAAGQACAAGGGKALLPSYVAEPLGLHRLEGPIAELQSEVWCLTHADMSRTPRIRAFIANVARTIRNSVEDPDKA